MVLLPGNQITCKAAADSPTNKTRVRERRRQGKHEHASRSFTATINKSSDETHHLELNLRFLCASYTRATVWSLKHVQIILLSPLTLNATPQERAAGGIQPRRAPHSPAQIGGGTQRAQPGHGAAGRAAGAPSGVCRAHSRAHGHGQSA